MNGSETKVYFVGGINAGGKTTLMNEIEANLPDFEIVRGSKLFMEWLGVNPGDYESLRKLPDDYKDIELDKMMRWLVEQKPKNGKHIIIDAHYLNIKPDDIVDVTGNWISLMDALFVVTAPSDEILKRMEQDEKQTGRSRSIFPESSTKDESLELIGSFQEKILLLAKSLSEKYHIPLVEIHNKNGKLANTINEFVTHHQLLVKDN
jgi:adenylate kinase